MPCQCRGVQFKACTCDVLRSGPWGSKPVLMNADCLRYQAMSLRAWLTTTIEGLYERCAAYNLRYCPYRTFSGSKHSVLRTLNDALVLAFFIAANFVVLLAIVTRMAVHMSCAVVESGKWIKRSFCTSSGSSTYDASFDPTKYARPQKPRIFNCS